MLNELTMPISHFRFYFIKQWLFSCLEALKLTKQFAGRATTVHVVAKRNIFSLSFPKSRRKYIFKRAFNNKAEDMSLQAPEVLNGGGEHLVFTLNPRAPGAIWRLPQAAESLPANKEQRRAKWLESHTSWPSCKQTCLSETSAARQSRSCGLPARSPHCHVSPGS